MGRGERRRISESEPEKCSHCGQQKPIALVLRTEEGDKPLCRECANKWLEEDTNFPQQPYITIYVL